jgi:TonB family protein
MRTYFARLPVLSLLYILLQAVSVSPIASQESKPDENTKKTFPTAGMNGVGVPVCTHRPNPDYTKKAREDKLQGSVILDAIVTVEGKVTDIRLLRGLGYGLDEKAIEAVKSWKFKPAKDGAGNQWQYAFQSKSDSVWLRNFIRLF